MFTDWSNSFWLCYKKNFVPLTNLSNFGIAEYDAHIKTEVDFAISQVSKPMNKQEMNTFHQTCDFRTITIAHYNSDVHSEPPTNC